MITATLGQLRATSLGNGPARANRVVHMLGLDPSDDTTFKIWRLASAGWFTAAGAYYQWTTPEIAAFTAEVGGAEEIRRWLGDIAAPSVGPLEERYPHDRSARIMVEALHAGRSAALDMALPDGADHDADHDAADWCGVASMQPKLTTISTALAVAAIRDEGRSTGSNYAARLISRLSGDHADRIKRAPTTRNQSELRTWRCDPDPVLRAAVVRNPWLHPPDRLRLAMDPSPVVRAAVEAWLETDSSPNELAGGEA